MIHTQPGRHRLQRLSSPVQQQPTQVRRALRPLIRPRHRHEQLRRERLKTLPHN
jgi:hypothetical protein